MLQVQYVDRLVGRLLDALRARGLYDDAVVVVTADHGASFVTGQPRRPANRANVGVIAPVPFFVKLPRPARAARVDDRAVRTIDVLPTIAEGGRRAAAVEGRRDAGRRARRSIRPRRSTSRTRASRR